jgi:hypothetical protein
MTKYRRKFNSSGENIYAVKRPRFFDQSGLLSATAIERMAVVSGVTVVPNPRIAGVALTGVHGYKTIAAMGKTLELDGGMRVLCRQEGGSARKNDEPLFHMFPPASMRAHCTAVFFAVSMNFGSSLAVRRDGLRPTWRSFRNFCASRSFNADSAFFSSSMVLIRVAAGRYYSVCRTHHFRS